MKIKKNLQIQKKTFICESLIGGAISVACDKMRISFQFILDEDRYPKLTWHCNIRCLVIVSRKLDQGFIIRGMELGNKRIFSS